MEWALPALRLVSGACVAVGLSLSPSLISIGVGGAALSALVDSSLRANLRKTFHAWRGLYLPFLLLYGLHAISWLYTTDKAQWLVEMRIKIPFLFLLPASIVLWRRYGEAERKAIHLLFHLGLLVVGIGTLWRFLQNPAWGLEEIKHGRYIPMVGGISHIYYAGLVGVGLFFLWELPLYGGRFWRFLIGGVHVFILHSLALRTGLGALYGTLIVLLMIWAIKDFRRWLWAIGAIAGIGMVVVIAVLYFPPMQRRWQSLREDLATYKRGHYITYSSVARRLAALQASCYAFQHAPIWGVGIADNQAAVFAQIPRLPYRWDKETYILPHNQFVEYAVGLGLIGAALFVAFWVSAFRQRLGMLWVGWLVYWLLLMQVEAFLERQVGVTAFLWGMGTLWAQLTQGKS
ncbi:MAG: O-antigen ligase family protein [Bacteroidia bacterium]|nr:O-antigen ligase family protein [Bacteroidia bacterium]MCX7764786.1 O-antigen ligase family protein [Bacteroidia bacterium]MDW8057813.1 O-antigen ligase family protein [Bacteroidia bacterium]